MSDLKNWKVEEKVFLKSEADNYYKRNNGHSLLQKRI